jgi:peroxiredoxin/protein-disulfide isomerase
MSSILAAGTVAPNFTLRVTPDQKLTLSDLRGKPVILAFYPADWSPVCGDQMTLYNEILPEFRKHDAELMGISVDGVWCHAAFARDRHLHFPLLSDFEPKGDVARKYHAYRASEASASARCSCWTDRARSHGAICLRSRSIPAQTEFSKLSNISQLRQALMATLKAPITRNDHINGPANAPITVVEYGDYECPHCGLAYPIVNQLQLSFSGRMRFVYRHFPLTEIHPLAEIAAESAEFAGAAGLFWDMHAALFENQSRLSIPTIFLIGGELGLPETALRNALETGQYRIKVRNDFMGGVRSGVNGTPTFFINGVRHDGAYDYASLVSAIQTRTAVDTNI